MAFALVSDAKKGISALQIKRNLGMHYETAWRMGHKIRELMAIENKDIELEGIIEMDETYVGGKPRKARRNKAPVGNIEDMDEKIDELKDMGFDIKEGKYKKPYMKEKPKRGRGTKKIPVVGIIEREGDVIAEVMQYTTYQNIREMVKKNVDLEESMLITDEYKSYNKLSRIIEHIKIEHEEMFAYKGINTNSIESFWAIIKRGIMGQYHHVSPKYLPNYIEEFVFKFNNRKDDDMFETLMNNSMLEKMV